MERMKTHNREQREGLSDTEFEASLHAALRDEGNLFPQTAEDIASLEADLNMNDVPTPDTQKFRKFLRQKAEKVASTAEEASDIRRQIPTNITKLVCSDPDSSEADQNLAMAARNGGEITEEVRKRMDADRNLAKEQIQKNNGTR